MGYYITNADVVSRMGTEQAARYSAEPPTAPNTGLIDKVILDQEGVVESYLTRENLPIDPTGRPGAYRAVAAAVMAFVIYTLALRKVPVPEDWRLAYDKYEAWLQKIADGDLDLPNGDDDGLADLEHGSNSLEIFTT